MGTPVILYDPKGKPLLTGNTPWGMVQMAVEPIRVYGNFGAVTNADAQTQTVVNCPAGQALYVTDIVLSANKTPASTVTLRFYDGTNSVNIYVADSTESTVNIAIHPSGKTLGWGGAYIQLLTTTANQAATCKVWYVRIVGEQVLSYAKWNSIR